jgi:CBS domain containing-hemolysin-like protein
MVPSASHHQVTAPVPTVAAYWPYLYSRCHSTSTTNITNTISRRKGGQIRFSAEQSLQLEKKFEISQYLSPIERKQIAKTLQLSERQVRMRTMNRLTFDK